MSRDVQQREMNMAREMAATLRAARIASGLTQYDMANRMRVPRPWFTKIESGRHTPRLLSIVNIGRELGLEGAWKLLQIAEAQRERNKGARLAKYFRRGGDVGIGASRLPAVDGYAFAVAMGATLKSARNARGLSQGHLEIKSGICRTLICRIEHGTNCPGMGLLLKFAAALDTPAWNLMRCAEMRLAQAEPQPQTPAA